MDMNMNKMSHGVRGISQDYDKLSGFLTDMSRNIHTSPVHWEVPMFYAAVQLSLTNILALTLLTAVGNLSPSVSGFIIVSLLTHKKVIQ